MLEAKAQKAPFPRSSAIARYLFVRRDSSRFKFRPWANGLTLWVLFFPLGVPNES
jgi:hypothetical protein